MKRVLVFALLLTLLAIPSTEGAIKKINVNKMQLITTISSPKEVSGVVVSNEALIAYGVRENNAYTRAINLEGKEIWSLVLSNSETSIATSAAVDNSGDVWIVGAMSSARTSIEPIQPPSLFNPDSTTISPDTSVGELSEIVIWKVSALGELISTSSFATKNALLPTAVAVDKNGASVVGIISTELGHSGFLLNMDSAGVFSKLLSIGMYDTTIESVVRHSDGSTTLVGASAESLMGKKVVGIKDGIILKVSRDLKISNVVRSSFPKSKRTWNSATSNLLLGGTVVTSNKLEVSVTKFSSKLTPVWSYRFESTAQGVTSGSVYLLFVSKTGTIQQLNWNPKMPTPLLLTFDSKGAIIAGDSAPSDQKQVLGLIASKKMGLLVVLSNDDTVSIFTLKSR